MIVVIFPLLVLAYLTSGQTKLKPYLPYYPHKLWFLLNQILNNGV